MAKDSTNSSTKPKIPELNILTVRPKFILIKQQRIKLKNISSYGYNIDILENKLIIRMKNNFIHEFLFENKTQLNSVLDILDSLFTIIKC